MVDRDSRGLGVEGWGLGVEGCGGWGGGRGGGLWLGLWGRGRGGLRLRLYSSRSLLLRLGEMSLSMVTTGASKASDSTNANRYDATSMPRNRMKMV